MSIQFNKTYFLYFIEIFIIETLIALYVHDQFIRPFFGDVLVVALVYCFLRSFVFITTIKACVFVGLFALSVELLQHFNFVALLGLQKVKIARIVLGTTFSWFDILAYFVGLIAVYYLEKFKIQKNN